MLAHRHFQFRWRASWIGILLLAVWTPCSYLAVFAYTAEKGAGFANSVAGGGGIASWEEREFGWPYPYLRYVDDLANSERMVSRKVLFFHTWILLADIGVSLLIAVVSVGTLIFLISRLRQRGFRYRLSTLLLIMLCASLPFWFLNYEYYRHQKEMTASTELNTLGVSVSFEYDGPLLYLRLRRLMPKMVSWRMRGTSAYFEERARAADYALILGNLNRFPSLKTLSFAPDARPDEFLPVVCKLPQLKFIDLRETQVTDNGLLALVACNHIREVDVRETTLSSAILQKLKAAQPQILIITNMGQIDH